MSPTTPSSAPELVGIALVRGAIAGLIVGTAPVLCSMVLEAFRREPVGPSAGPAMLAYAGAYGTVLGAMVGCVVGAAVSVVRRRVRRLWIASALVTFVLFAIPSLWWFSSHNVQRHETAHSRTASPGWAIGIPLSLATVAAIAASGVRGDVGMRSSEPETG